MRRLVGLLLSLLLLACPAVGAPEEGPGGTVTLPLEDFVRMTARPAPAGGAPSAAPQAHLFSNGRYRVEAGRDWAVVRATQDLALYAGGWQEVPLLPTGTVLAEVTLDGLAVPVYEKDGTLRILARGRGQHQVRVVYHAAITVDGASRGFEFRSLPGAVAAVRLSVPGTGLRVEAQPQAPLSTTAQAGRTVVEAALPGQQAVTFRWSPRVADAPASREKARVAARLYVMAQVSEREIRTRSRVDCTIQRNELDSLVLALPPKAEVVELACPNLAGWETVDREGLREVHVALSKPASGSLALDLTTELPLGNPNSTWELPRIQVVGAEKVKGSIGVSASEALELSPADEPLKARRIDPAELPPQALQLGTHVPVLAYEYHTDAHSIRLESRLGKQVALLTAAVDQASGQTLVTPEGKCISTFTWQLRNNQNQYLQVQLPEGGRIWSAFVDGRAVKPLEEGKTLKLPLVSSQESGQELASFPVEITFVGAEAGQAWLGRQGLQAPRLVGVPIAQLAWSVFLPEDLKILGFGGSLEPAADQPRPQAPTAPLESKAEVRQEAQVASDEAPPAPQAAAPGGADLEGGARADKGLSLEANKPQESAMAQMVQTTSQGSFPVRVRVPLEGQAWQFSQLMVGDESPTLEIRYYKPQLLKAAGWATLLAVLALGQGLTRRPGGWKSLAWAAAAMALLGWLLAGTPAGPLVSAAFQGLGLLALAWLWRHRLWLLDTVKTRAQRAEEVPS